MVQPDSIAVSGIHDSKNLPMYAYGEYDATKSNQTLTFHNICAALQITIPNAIKQDARKCKKIKISSSTNICGSFTVDANNVAKLSSPAGTDDTTLTVTGLFYSTTSVIYVPIPEGEYNRFTIKFYGDDDELIGHKSTTYSTSLDLDANNVYPVTVGNPTITTPTPTTETLDANIFRFVPDGGNATITFTYTDAGEDKDAPVLEYFTRENENAGTGWRTLSLNTGILVKSGDSICIRAKQNEYYNLFAGGTSASKAALYYHFTSSANVKVGGNPSYLTDYNGEPVPSGSYVFAYLFAGMTTITDASCMILEPTRNGQYYYMFKDCSNLVKGPTISVTSLPSSSCASMFSGCTQLNSVTMLATTIGSNALSNWLNGAGPTSGTLPILTVNSSITSTSSDPGKTIKNNTPTNWTIISGNTTLRTGTASQSSIRRK